jgi:hypothetical protein
MRLYGKMKYLFQHSWHGSNFRARYGKNKIKKRGETNEQLHESTSCYLHLTSKNILRLTTYILRLFRTTTNEQLHESTSCYLHLTSKNILRLTTYYLRLKTSYILLLTTYVLRLLRTTKTQGRQPGCAGLRFASVFHFVAHQAPTIPAANS